MTAYKSRPTYVEVDGEIMPSYTGVNAPRYAHGEALDTEPPHDFIGSGPLESFGLDPSTPSSIDGYAVPLDQRDSLLIQVMNKWAEANKLEGLAKGMKTPAHRQRLGADDELANGAGDKARQLRSEARDFFEAATGVHEMDSTGEVSPEVLVLSFFQDFKSRYLTDKNQLDKRRKLHRKNMQNRQSR